MIYRIRDAADPVRQGDIFKSIPVITFAAQEAAVVTDDGSTRVRNWVEMVEQPLAEALVIVQVRIGIGIVITQDCDAWRGEQIALAEIRPFDEIVPPVTGERGSVNWFKRSVDRIVRQSKLNAKWFYLPADPTMNFTQPMGADFTSICPVGRLDLEALRVQHRLGSLNDEALDHFRHRVGAFFTRYAHDEWYSLTREEFERYRSDQHNDPSIVPRPWQQGEE